MLKRQIKGIDMRKLMIRNVPKGTRIAIFVTDRKEGNMDGVPQLFNFESDGSDFETQIDCENYFIRIRNSLFYKPLNFEMPIKKSLQNVSICLEEIINIRLFVTACIQAGISFDIGDWDCLHCGNTRVDLMFNDKPISIEQLKYFSI